MKLGVMVYMLDDIIDGREFGKLREMGFSSCQLCCWEDYKYTGEFARKVGKTAEKYGVEITAFWCGYSAPVVFNFYEGPATIGLVPAAYRLSRMQTLIRGANFAAGMGVTDVVTHAGFIPEDPNHPDYTGTISALKEIAGSCRKNHQYFLFETGQETPVTLKRAMEDIGTDNLGVNLDPANLLMYGKANPVDALEVIGPFVRGVHAKDGEYPRGGKSLGEEKPLGEGRVNYPAFIAGLKRLGYDGPVTIEREITGEQQIKDILTAKALLEKLIGKEV